MASQRRVVVTGLGAITPVGNTVEDAWTTMALVEAAFASSAAPATPLARHP